MPLRVPLAARSVSALSRPLTSQVPRSSMTHRAASQRTAERVNSIARHMSSSAPRATATEVPIDGHMNGLVQLLKDGSSRTIRLNRPKALNAMNEEMVVEFGKCLKATAESPNCATVILRGEGRALCAGGDIMVVVDAANEKSMEQRERSTSFFTAELKENWNVANYENMTAAQGRMKYYISFMDGITMGGGIGISANAPFRVVTERTLYAMPEVAIGYYPDAGVTYVYSRLDGNAGMYLALTGNRLNGADTYLLGLATHYVRSNLLDDLAQRLGTLPVESVNSGSVVNNVIDEFASDPFASDTENGAELVRNSVFLGDRRVVMDFCFGRDSVEQILASLKDVAEMRQDSYTLKELAKRGLESISPEVQTFAKTTLDELNMRSPRALIVTFREMQRASKMPLLEIIHENIHICTVFCDLSLGRDFYTGVKHTLTKDPETGKRRTGRAPWSPATLEEVDHAQLEKLCFSTIEDARKAGLQLHVPKLDVPPVPNTREYRKKRDAELRGVGPLRWNPSYNVWALPSEAECEALVEGSHPAAGSYVMEPHELVDVMARHKKHKPALHLKMIDWLRRRTAAKK